MRRKEEGKSARKKARLDSGKQVSACALGKILAKLYIYILMKHQFWWGGGGDGGLTFKTFFICIGLNFSMAEG